MQRRARQFPTKIFLARHGQSIYNAEKRLSGQLDPSLTPQGRCQAHLLARALQEEHLAAIYTSTLSRAIETARPTALAHGLLIQQRSALNELHFGILQGRFRDARDPTAQRLWTARRKEKVHYRFAGGETFADLAQRVLPCLDEILTHEAGKVVLIVAHRNTNLLLLSALLHWPLEVTLGFDMRNGHLYEILPGEAPCYKTIVVGEARAIHPPIPGVME